MKAKRTQGFLSLVVLLIACVSAGAQSGRRGAGKSTTATVPSVSGAKEVEVKPQKAGRLQLIVGIDTASPMTTIPYYLADTVLDECIRRLGEASDVIVRPAGQHLTRGDAAKLAKAEKERYVVWLQLGNDLAGTSSQNRNGPNELWVNYVILEPVTAKTKQAGRAYHSIYKVGNVGVSGPSSRQNPVYSEYAIKQSAREAADRILEAFDIRIGDGLPRRVSNEE
jgi:hypothetical protein